MKRTFLSTVLCLLCACLMYAGSIDTLVLYSDTMNRDIEVIVVAPVKAKKAKGGKCPVVYLLHGAYGDAKAWLSIKPNLSELADEFGMIFVTPSVLNSWYIDSPKMKDFQYETFMIKQLVPYIDAHYNTYAQREGRAITGLSMGGHGALFLSMRHKEMFGAAGSMSGGVDIRPFPLNWNLPDILGEMASNKQAWDDHTVVNQISRISNGDLAITFDCGESDFFLQVNKDLHARLLGRGIDHDFTTRPGGHTSEYWNNSLDYHLLFFAKYFKKHNIIR